MLTLAPAGMYADDGQICTTAGLLHTPCTACSPFLPAGACTHNATAVQVPSLPVSGSPALPLTCFQCVVGLPRLEHSQLLSILLLTHHYQGKPTCTSSVSHQGLYQMKTTANRLCTAVVPQHHIDYRQRQSHTTQAMWSAARPHPPVYGWACAAPTTRVRV
jgi:hypothetical protein